MYNLEEAPKIGVMDSFCEGYGQFFKNFVPFCKTLKPLALLGVSIFLTLTPVFFAAYEVKIPLLLISIPLFFAGLILFLYSFWQSLLGNVAVSYLAKDIFEDKPIQDTKKYFGYVRAHAKSYIKLWLWHFLFCAIYSAISYFAGVIHPLIGSVYAILTIPFVLALSAAIVFWAYQDKTYPLDSIILAIKTFYENAFKTLGFFILLGISVIPVLIILWLLNFLTLAAGIWADSSPLLVQGSIGKFAVCFVLCFTVSVPCFLTLGYFQNFVFTRFYFSLIKNMGRE